MSTYYNTTEAVTSRADFDATMKWVITNIANKLQIPSERLPNGKYTWSVSNVATEMGLPPTTTFYRFKMLEKLKVLREIGTKRTTHGECVIYDADRGVFAKLLSGELTIPKELLREVRKSKEGSSAGDEAGLSPRDEASSPREIRISAGDRASSPAETSTQMEYSKGTIQNVPVQNGATEHPELKKADDSVGQTTDTEAAILTTPAPIEKYSAEYWRQMVAEQSKNKRLYGSPFGRR